MKKCHSRSYLSFPRRRESRGVNSGRDPRSGRIYATLCHSEQSEESACHSRESGNPVGKNRGVTLIEMIIVMAIIVIMTAASMPSFLKFINTSRLRGGARDITTALRTARRLAITTRISRAVTIHCTGGSIEKAISYYSTSDTIELKRLPATISASRKYHGALDTGPSPFSKTFTFTARGTGTAGTIYVADGETPPNYIPITVVTATGRVKMFDINYP